MCFARVCRKIRIPTKNIILLESHPDYSDNTFALFEKMIEHKINRKYKIVWMLHNYKDNKEFGESITNNYIHPHRIKDRILNKYYRLFAKYIIFCNEEVEKLNKRTASVYLTHGIYFKAAAAQYKYIDYAIYNTKFGNIEFQNHSGLTEEKIIKLGFPRNDYLFKGKEIAKEYFNAGDNRIIIWMPTFRKTHDRVDANVEMPYGVPILKEEKDFSILNETLKKHKTILVIKPHPLQLIEKNIPNMYENILFLDSFSIQNSNIQLYELLGGSDALITDYSSVYFDYLITDNLIGITEDDVEEYEKGVGFIDDNSNKLLEGYRIKNINDMMGFIETLNNSEKDLFIKKQKRLNHEINIYRDCNSSDRVFDYIFG